MSTISRETLVKYKTLPVWTEKSLPQTFQTRHNTKQGTWGKIIVAEGQLQFDALDEAGNILTTEIITPENTDFFVAPGEWHRVKPLGLLRCWVEFFCHPEDYYQKKYRFAAPHHDVRALIQGPLSQRQTMHVLDLGSGKGRNATYLHALGHRVTALDRNVSAIHHLQDVIDTENTGDTFQARVYDIELASLSGNYDLILSTVVFQFLERDALSKVIENMQAQTHLYGYNFIIAPISSLEFPCPVSFPSTFAPQELCNHYAHWQIHMYQEQPGTFHRKDDEGNFIKATFAILLAQKRTRDMTSKSKY